MIRWLDGLHRRIVMARAPRSGGPTMDFICNICGGTNRGAPVEQVQGRETPSCRHCGSILRFRAVMHALSMELYGRALVVEGFPTDKSISGLGMSDHETYARKLERKLSYANTFYHAEPRLDITAIADDAIGRHRFLISSDVFEHIPLFALDAAFRNSRRLLRDDGFFLFTVPYVKTGETREHFPRLHDFRIDKINGRYVLRNKTAEGEEETFENLVFHGGPGSTLEMRLFSEADLMRRLKAAGFSSIHCYEGPVPEFGILWPPGSAVPIVARA
jgi:hypothetical protein